LRKILKLFYRTKRGAMEYVTIFDVSQSGYKYWWFDLATMLLISVFIYFYVKNRKSPSGNFERAAYWLFPALLVFLAIIPMHLDHYFLKQALLEGRCEMEEGPVTGFVPQTANLGSKSEKFEVNGTRFRYSYNEFTSGFNQTWVFGGPIRDGLKVRIFYLPNNQNKIAKLEVAK
jgi:hypothetical protein